MHVACVSKTDLTNIRKSLKVYISVFVNECLYTFFPSFQRIQNQHKIYIHFEFYADKFLLISALFRN
jgi:hypothetical protein